METSTKVLLAGLAAFAGLSLYSRQSNGSLNPLALLTSGPPLPKATPQLPAGTPAASPEVQAAKTALQAIPSSFPNSPEIQAAASVIQTAPPNSPEAQAALNLLLGLTSSPEAQAALNFLQAQGQQAQSHSSQTQSPQPQNKPTTFVPGVIDEPLVKNGDIVNVDMFTSGMNLPQNIPLVGLIFMHVDSLEAGAPDKFLASFVTAEFRVFGQQMVNRAAIKGKG